MADSREDIQAVRAIRKLVVDCCRQNGAGHGGSAIGMAPLAVALWRHTMRYSSANPDWYDRDRFVISNGHAGILLYVMLHLTGSSEITMEALKGYANPKMFDSATGTVLSTPCHGHPEREIPGIEVTTGPLGQGIANAVGMAIAGKQQAALFNKPGFKVIDSHVYCTTGDGCLQEGVAMEAIDIAAHYGLDNLILCYDNNAVTCDGPLEWINSADYSKKMEAAGWHVIDVFRGDESTNDIAAALRTAKSNTGKPTFINIRTTIGYGTSTAGTAKSHHGTYTDEDAAKLLDDPNAPSHTIPESTAAYFQEATAQGNKLEADWNQLLERYAKEYPTEYHHLQDRMNGKLDYEKLLESITVPTELKATREANGYVFDKLINGLPSLFAGGADLWGANKLGDRSKITFDRNHNEGHVIRYGIREHAMASISNGIAAYSPGAFVPITATFFMFYLYAAAGVRMGALNGLQVIHVATHDSIGEGQNGPTHQPVELDSLYRAMPSLLYIRPADGEEVVGAWDVALAAKDQSSLISLARDPVGVAVPNTNRKSVKHGGYVVIEKQDAQVTLISCGSELQFAAAAAAALESLGITTRVVSMPCIRLFDEQPEDYKDAVLSSSPHVISVEAYVSTIWARYCTASIGMSSFGFSASGQANFARFGIDADGIVAKVKKHVAQSQLANGHGSSRAVKWKLLA